MPWRDDISETASLLRDLVSTRPPSPRWLLVADTNVYIRGITGNSNGPNRKLIEASLLEVVVLVTSREIFDEAVDVLCRPEISDMTEAEAVSALQKAMDKATWVDLAPDEPHYRKATGDPDDAIVLRTAAGIYSDPTLSDSPHRYIVSGDTHAFPSGGQWYGFHHATASELWESLEHGSPSIRPRRLRMPRRPRSQRP